MPTFDITAPDGKQYTVEGADAQGAMAALQKHVGQPAEVVKPPPDDIGAADTAIDVAKSGGIGLAKGVIGIGGTAGDVRHMASAATDYLGEKLGASPEGIQSFKDKAYNAAKYTTVGKVLADAPASSDIQKGIEGYTGEFYKPKTTYGEYAQTVGEFAPAAIGGGGSLVARGARMLAPALLSETAGQATKGTEAEPYARIAGALLSPILPAAARRVITPIRADPHHAALADALRAEGVSLTAGQATGNKPLQWMESALGDMPGSGGRAAEIQTRQAEQFTAAAMRRVGENSTRADTPAVNAAFDRIGKNFDRLETGNKLHVDQKLEADLNRAYKDYNNLVGPNSRAPIVENTLKDLEHFAAKHNDVIPGETYQSVASNLRKLTRSTANPELKSALGDIQHSLDNAMERSIQAHNPADLGSWQEARNQYRNLMVVAKAAEGAGADTAKGLLSPSQLRTAVKSQNPRDYVRGRGDYNELAHAGEGIMKPLPNSGTAPRLYAQHMLSALSGAAGGSVAGLPGAVAAAALPATVGRALMSTLAQKYLGNRAVGAAPGSRMNEGIAAALLAHQGQSSRE